MVTARAPAAVIVMAPTVMAVPVSTGMETNPEWPPAIAEPEPPAHPGVVADMKSPGAVAGIFQEQEMGARRRGAVENDSSSFDAHTSGQRVIIRVKMKFPFYRALFLVQ